MEIDHNPNVIIKGSPKWMEIVLAMIRAGGQAAKNAQAWLLALGSDDRKQSNS